MNEHFAMERSTIFKGKIHYFDWAIFHSFLYVHQRVYIGTKKNSLQKKTLKYMCSGVLRNKSRIRLAKQDGWKELYILLVWSDAIQCTNQSSLLFIVAWFSYHQNPCAHDWLPELHDVACIWANYNNSPTWIKAILGWFLLLTMIPVRSQWGRYNLPRCIVAVVRNTAGPFKLCLSEMWGNMRWLIGRWPIQTLWIFALQTCLLFDRSCGYSNETKHDQTI